MRINRYTVLAILVGTVIAVLMNALLALGTGLSLLIGDCVIALFVLPDWSRVMGPKPRRTDRSNASRYPGSVPEPAYSASKLARSDVVLAPERPEPASWD